MCKRNKINYLLILMPLIDLISSLQARSMVNFPSVGMIMKGIICLIIIYYIFFVSGSRFKKGSIMYLCLILFFFSGYFFFKPDLLDSSFLYQELAYLLRMLFFPTVFMGLINYYDEYGFEKESFIKAMVITICEYTLLLLIPLLFNIAFQSYSTGLHGYVGWFYAANEISVIMILLFSFIYCIFKHGKYNFFIALPVIYVIAHIGTKVTLMGTLIVSVLSLIFIMVKYRFKLNRNTVGALITLAFCLLFFFGNKAIALNNIKQMAEEQHFEFIETPVRENANTHLIKKTKFSKKVSKLIVFLISNRNDYYKQSKNIYTATFTYDYLLFGMGHSDTERINNKNAVKTIEIDYLDLFFQEGIIGLVIEILPFIITVIIVIKCLFKRGIAFINKWQVLYNSIIIGMLLCIAAVAGHIILYPAVSLYVALYLMYTLDNTALFKKKKINPNKVSILALHLNTGGIETVICNHANMLSSVYNVEVVSVYKSKTPYVFNKKVKINYLLDTISNREEIKNSLKEKKLFKFLKESFKALKILYLKKYRLRQYILNSDAQVIISTRVKFSEMLGRYKRNNIVTISEEHVYHLDDDRYINSVVKANQKIDYFMPTSKELADFYQDKVKGTIDYLPHSINSFTTKKQNYKNIKLLAVGRLSSEKGFITLVDVMYEVVKQNRHIILDIYGDGPEKDKIIQAIKDNHLEKNVFIKGFVKIEKLNALRHNYAISLCSSYEESFGLAILESMAFRIPCIAFDDASGLKEFMNANNGIMIPNRDVKKMADSIIKLTKDKTLLAKYADEAYNTAKKYDYNLIKDKYVDYITKTIANNSCKHKKILLISSSGGHFNELMQLKSFFVKYDYSIITEKSKINSKLKKKYPKRVFFLHSGTKYHLFKYLLFTVPLNIIRTTYLYFKIRPDYIITTGAHSAVPMCLIGKMFNSRIIYIESFANSHSRSLSGRIVYPLADLFIVQWESMLSLYPNAINGGWIY